MQCCCCLEQVHEHLGLDGLDVAVALLVAVLEAALLLQGVGCLGLDVLALEVDLHARLTGLDLGSLVLLDASENLRTALRRLHVLQSDVNLLLHNSPVDELVHTYSHSTLGDVEDNASSAMVELVGHTLVLGRVGENIDVITHLVVDHKGGELRHRRGTKALREHIASAGAVTIGVRHLPFLLQKCKSIWDGELSSLAFFVIRCI
mmetsp:Transcript_2408/g.3870  ORF Transcript_2408/g.3870 Transcript_2408/m.3870 type:complete len:205 (-) Transcript_2408:4-618(-)